MLIPKFTSELFPFKSQVQRVYIHAYEELHKIT